VHIVTMDMGTAPGGDVYIVALEGDPVGSRTANVMVNVSPSVDGSVTGTVGDCASRPQLSGGPNRDGEVAPGPLVGEQPILKATEPALVRAHWLAGNTNSLHDNARHPDPAET
jgi:hypothetical protein